jgi:predicted DNA-binding transcriptional regulator AlpA
LLPDAKGNKGDSRACRFLKHQWRNPMTLLTQREAATSREDELLDLKEVCRLFGGNRPINPATLYRGAKAGRYPKPIKIGPNASRWLRSEIDAALQAMIARRAAQ